MGSRPQEIEGGKKKPTELTQASATRPPLLLFLPVLAVGVWRKRLVKKKKKRAWLWLFAPRRGEALFPRRGEGRGGGANPLLISDVSIYLPLEKSEKRVQRRTGGVGKSLVNGGGFSFSASLVLLAKRKGAKEKRGGGGDFLLSP